MTADTKAPVRVFIKSPGDPELLIECDGVFTLNKWVDTDLEYILAAPHPNSPLPGTPKGIEELVQRARDWVRTDGAPQEAIRLAIANTGLRQKEKPNAADR